MSNDNNVKKTFEQIENINIYSKKMIWGFSILFTPLFGGVLLMQNLKDIGKKKEAYIILIFSFLYTVIAIFILNIQENPNSILGIILNLIGGGMLSETFYKKYIPVDISFGRKKIWKPLIISLIILILIIMIQVFAK